MADDLTSRTPTPLEAVAAIFPGIVASSGVLRTVFYTGDVPLEVQQTVGSERHEFRNEVSMDGDGWPHAASGPLRVGACLSLSGRYARFGSQAGRALQA